MKAATIERVDVVEDIHSIRKRISKMGKKELLELDKGARQLEMKLRKDRL